MLHTYYGEKRKQLDLKGMINRNLVFKLAALCFQECLTVIDQLTY